MSNINFAIQKYRKSEEKDGSKKDSQRNVYFPTFLSCEMFAL